MAPTDVASMLLRRPRLSCATTSLSTLMAMHAACIPYILVRSLSCLQHLPLVVRNINGRHINLTPTSVKRDACLCCSTSAITLTTNRCMSWTGYTRFPAAYCPASSRPLDKKLNNPKLYRHYRFFWEGKMAKNLCGRLGGAV